jgi:hypothetical protein
MLMTAKEIKTQYRPGDYNREYHGTHAGLWKMKLSESNDPHDTLTNNQLWEDDWRVQNNDQTDTLTESIKKHGIQTPVNIYHDDNPSVNRFATGSTILRNGHHRVAVAGSISPNYLVPVEHTDAGYRYPGDANSRRDYRQRLREG